MSRRYVNLCSLRAFKPRCECESISPVFIWYTLSGERRQSSGEANGHFASVVVFQGICLFMYVLHCVEVVSFGP